MNGKQTKKLRRLSRQLTTKDAPYEEFETKNVQQLVPPQWVEYLKTQEEGYEGDPVYLDWNPIMIATFFLTQGCTRNIYNTLKKAYKQNASRGAYSRG